MGTETNLKLDNSKAINPGTAGQIKQSTDNSLSIDQYHSNEIIQSKKIINTAIGVIIAGTALICVSILLAVFKGIIESLITASAGVLIDWISSTILKMYEKENEDRIRYFRSKSLDVERNEIIALINKVQGEAERIKLIDKLVDNYCKKSQKE